MKTSAIISLLTCIVMMVSAQQPIPCCAPPQFVLHYEQVLATQTADMPMAITEETLDAAYDFVNALVGMDLTIRPLNQPETKARLVQNFTAGYQWIIQGATCIKQSLAAVTPPARCVPEDAIFEGTFDVGLEKLKVHTWLINATAPGPIKGTQRYTVADYMCTPFSSTFIGTESNTQPPTTFVNSGNYMNFSNKITDPDHWFKLPSSCNSTASEVPVTERMIKLSSARHMRFF
ncbi:development-specific protein LVN1.2 [Strongylocentrotus purpuratus]|uniref:Uncharacterized protein n=1 Tax=Strongylocentrotus purpuratus TaxID=7668 RepID=A0A7M7RDX4_STRPU|nr:development-specific protein LVN1.2 [Strongylocentrotus purpuratus]|eukprot:XP_011670640.1 PREDICTED: development-specific protein LVN1.2 [Strongylocentrotus purpuratus]